MSSLKLLPILALTLLLGCASRSPLVVSAPCYKVPPPPPRAKLLVPGALQTLSQALPPLQPTTTPSFKQSAQSGTPSPASECPAGWIVVKGETGTTCIAPDSWSQDNLKRNDTATCPTAIFIAPGGELEQCP